MAIDVFESLEALDGYPTLSQAAEMLGVSTSTLSRRKDVAAEPRGDRDRVLRPAEVLRLAGIYRKRAVEDVAADLERHLHDNAPDEVRQFTDDLTKFKHIERLHAELRQLKTLANRHLPAELAEQIERSVDEQV